MIDFKTYDFYNFNLKDFKNDWYIEYDWIYWNTYFKNENNKIIVFYTNYDKNRILELFVFDKLKDWINIDFYKFYKVITIDWKSKIEKELKHIEKQIKIKENYNVKYDIYSSIYKKYIWYKYTIDRLFNNFDLYNILFDKYHIQKAIEYIN